MRSICNKIIHAQTISVRAIIWPKTSGIRMIWRAESIRKIKDSIDEGGDSISALCGGSIVCNKKK